MLDFLTMEQSLGFSLDDFTYAEAAQMYCEHGREKWQHTAHLLAQTAAVHADSKSKRFPPDHFNPWEAGSKQEGVPLTRDNLHLMQGLAGNVSRKR